MSGSDEYLDTSVTGMGTCGNRWEQGPRLLAGLGPVTFRQWGKLQVSRCQQSVSVQGESPHTCVVPVSDSKLSPAKMRSHDL